MKFIFSKVHRSMNAMGPMQCLGVTYFARDPLRSYFDEPQKNEIYFLNDLPNVVHWGPDLVKK